MIHKEGKKTILFTIILLVILNTASFIFIEYDIVFWSLVLFSLILLCIIVQFFRNPNRIPELNENSILSPADGKVVVIERTIESEYFKDERLMVSVFMSLWNVHVNRYPVSGSLCYFKYHKGKYLIARNPKSSLENERTTVVIEDRNRKILFRQIAGIVARRIVWYMESGDEVIQGSQCGFIKFGSRVDLFLPVDTKLQIQIGDTVKAGITVLADYKELS
jgi:phosphatidylserine decarboxylase